MMLACAHLASGLALAASVSWFPEKPVDERAVELARPRFAVHANGVGDDAPALQQAIDEVERTTHNGIVFIPEGRYLLGSTVNLWRGIRLIGYGRQRPVFVLGARTPGFADGAVRYMVHFRDQKPRAGQPLVDAQNTTFFSGISNVDFEIEKGNQDAVAVRFRVAQLSSLEHIEFRVGAARGAVEAIGNEIEDCRFVGGEFGIKTGATSPGWQALVMDSAFEGQRRAAIETGETGLTVVRGEFRDVPHAIVVTEGANEKLFVKDTRFERVGDAAIVVHDYWDPRTQVNVENARCAETPVFLTFRALGAPPSRVPDTFHTIRGRGAAYVVTRLSHGLHVEQAATSAALRRLRTVVEQAPVAALGPGVPKDFPVRPAQVSWVNVAALGAKGDGVADDTPVFREAIRKHEALFVPMGRYRLTETLVLGADTALIGLHPSETRFVLAPETAGFTRADAPKAMIETPRGGRCIVEGLGFDPGKNPGAVALKWMAGERSYLDDAFFPFASDRAGKGRGQLYGLWVTQGGGGTFKNIWAPNDAAQLGLYVSQTSTPGRVYLTSVEHHVEAEVRIEAAANWFFCALQTEENIGSENALAIDVRDSHDLAFANLFLYRIRATPKPHPHAMRVKGVRGLVIRGVHNFSGGPFPFDTTLFDAGTGQAAIDREAAWVSVP